MQRKFKLGALAWGIAAAMAFPAGAAADTNNAAVCNQLATGSTNAANQCKQDNTATNSQTTTTTGGNGGTATGGNAGPSQVVGNGSQGGSFGGSAWANGGGAESHSSLESDQSNQVSGRDSSLGSYVGVVGNNTDVCKQLATGNTQGNDQCHQTNTATNTQTTTTTGGNGGTATGGNAGPSQVVGDGSEGGSFGGSAYANGGDAESHSSVDNGQSNQISGRDSSGSNGQGSDETVADPNGGNNNAAVCNQLATGNTNAANQCAQDNTATNSQTTTTTGGNGGTATGGNAGPSQVVGNGSQGGSFGGNAYANGGYAESHSSLENEQSNQISGRDSSGSDYSGVGSNNSAICNLLATGNTFGPDQCHQTNTATNTQITSTFGGFGGTATGGDAAPSQVVGDDSEGGSSGGDAYANGGYAESHSSLENEQSNQISGRDSQGKATLKKSKKAKASKKAKTARKRAKS